MTSYVKNVLIGFDQLLNAIFKGMPDETLSSRAWRHHEKDDYKWPCRVIDSLLWFDKDHCRTSYEAELERKQLPHSMQKGES